MPGTDVSTTNTWLGIIAVASVIELVVVVAAVTMAARAAARSREMFRDIERRLTPLTLQLSAALDDLHDVTARVQRADNNLRSGAERVQTVLAQASTLGSQLFPAMAIGKAILAGAQALRRSPHKRARPSDAVLQKLDEARLVSEGGHEAPESRYRT